MREAVTSADLFSQPFMLRANKVDKVKNTFFGGLLTISIFLLSLAYFGYLLYVYFKRLTPPTVTTTHKVNYMATSIPFDFPPISFQMNMPVGCKICFLLIIN